MFLKPLPINDTKGIMACARGDSGLGAVDASEFASDIVLYYNAMERDAVDVYEQSFAGKWLEEEAEAKAAAARLDPATHSLVARLTFADAAAAARARQLVRVFRSSLVFHCG